jgi:hypothetical protein
MQERYHATTQNQFYPDMSNVNKNVTVEAKLISPPTYIYIYIYICIYIYTVYIYALISGLCESFIRLYKLYYENIIIATPLIRKHDIPRV